MACRYAARVRTDCGGKVVGGCLKTHWQEHILLSKQDFFCCYDRDYAWTVLCSLNKETAAEPLAVVY